MSVLLRGFAEEDVDPVEGDCAAADHQASSNRAPENVGSRKLPDRQQGGQDGYQNA